MRVFLILLCSLLFHISVFTQTINVEKSFVEFKVKSMKVHTINGSFKVVSGIIQLDTVNHFNEMLVLHISASSINTGIEKRDRVLKGEFYFNTAMYPTVSFLSEKVLKISQNKWEAKGMLNIKGVAHVVTIPFSIQKNIAKGNICINRLDYGVGGTGTFFVDKDVQINFKCVIN
ncbi:YceI family protein [Labilibacter marinus]|uniref:YceI family protein n=1 Tax=Labilibacter marinus TaxID=1477105 RepID=UPI0009501870|nr:YceI family protein [Labilibacter marinus]